MKKADKGSKGELPEFVALGKVLAALKPLDTKERTWVVASAMSNLEVGPAPFASGVAGAVAGAVGSPGTGNALIAGEPGSDAHAKAFLRQKAPRSDVQRIACLAYYLTTFRNTPTFKTKDLTKMNNDAKGTALGNISQAVDNASKAKYLAASGKGRKHLTGFGESIVDALPNQEEVAKVVAAERPGKKRAKRKKNK